MPANHPKLLENFPHLRVVWKAGAGFLAVLGGIHVLGGWWAPAEKVRQLIYAETSGVPLLFIGFYAITLLYECVIRQTRLGIEERRSDPMEPRRAKVKAARQQRLRNQRRS
jgi:hypothetical protein